MTSFCSFFLDSLLFQCFFSTYNTAQTEKEAKQLLLGIKTKPLKSQLAIFLEDKQQTIQGQFYVGLQHLQCFCWFGVLFLFSFQIAVHFPVLNLSHPLTSELSASQDCKPQPHAALAGIESFISNLLE